MKKMTIYIIIGVIILVFVGLGIWYFLGSNNSPLGYSETENSDAYIIISSKTSNMAVGSIGVKDGQLHFVIEDGHADLTKYLNDHKTEWEKSTFRVPTGGMREDGTIWDGDYLVKINDSKFITGLYASKFNEYDSKTIMQDKYSYKLGNIPFAKITEIRDFSCSGMEGFTFKYPVFEGWGGGNASLRSDNKSCVISLQNPSNNNSSSSVSALRPPGIVVTKTNKPESPPKFAVKNINNVFYSYSKEELSNGDYAPSHYGYVNFYTPDYEISISLDVASKENGFPSDRFFQTVIESFKFIK